MERLPVEVVALVREYLTPTFNSMLSLTCKSLFDEKRTCRVHAADVATSVSLIQYVYRGIPNKPKLFTYAARGGSLEVLQWVVSHCGGSKWLRMNGYSSKLAYAWAASRGHLHVIGWLRENGAGWDNLLGANAAENGHLHVIRWLASQSISPGGWLRENGAPLDEWMCECAARGGHLHVLQWLRESGVGWDRDMCLRMARRRAHVHVVAWIEEQMRASLIPP